MHNTGKLVSNKGEFEMLNTKSLFRTYWYECIINEGGACTSPLARPALTHNQVLLRYSTS